MATVATSQKDARLDLRMSADARWLKLSARAFDEFARLLDEPQPEDFSSFLSQETIWES